MAWHKSNPEVPDGPWYKDFGSFKLCGTQKHFYCVVRRLLASASIEIFDPLETKYAVSSATASLHCERPASFSGDTGHALKIAVLPPMAQRQRDHSG
jgi:hypothetical protein